MLFCRVHNHSSFEWVYHMTLFFLLYDIIFKLDQIYLIFLMRETFKWSICEFSKLEQR